MFVEEIDLGPHSPGTRQTLTVFRFGRAGARPKVYIQGALHADEIPGMIAAQRLIEHLKPLDEAGLINGEIIVVPVANPIGLGQTLLGSSVGRFDFMDGGNFNRGFPDLADGLAQRIERTLGLDEAENVAIIHAALIAEVDALKASTPAEALKHALLRLAIDSDAVLDLHCDSEAVMHLYTLTPHANRADGIARYLQCEAVLLATESGDDPFDEATSRPWLEMQRRFPAYPVPLACMAMTVELRGQRDVSEEMASKDAAALLDFLILERVISGVASPLPPRRCEPTPLAGCEPLTAPIAGIILFDKRVGDRVEGGERIARLVDPLTGDTVDVAAQSSGVFFARSSRCFAQAGQRLGKIAGTSLMRTGNLLSP